MTTYLHKIVTFINDEEGASSIEYALLAMLIAVAILAGVSAFGVSLKGLYDTNAAKVAAALP
jgi:pilus assembly protein Flp/PilA